VHVDDRDLVPDDVMQVASDTKALLGDATLRLDLSRLLRLVCPLDEGGVVMLAVADAAGGTGSPDRAGGGDVSLRGVEAESVGELDRHDRDDTGDGGHQRSGLPSDDYREHGEDGDGPRDQGLPEHRCQYAGHEHDADSDPWPAARDHDADGQHARRHPAGDPAVIEHDVDRLDGDRRDAEDDRSGVEQGFTKPEGDQGP
jgi:hypothetical protein